MSASVMGPLASFAGKNTFDELQPFEDESIPDIESTDTILLRLTQRAEAALKEKESNTHAILPNKLGAFEDGELDDSWVIVAPRRSSYKQIPEDVTTPKTATSETAETSIDIEQTKGKRRWKKVLFSTVGSIAAAGVVTFLFLKRRNKKET